MTQRIKGPDGVFNNFPDDMPDDQISNAMKAAYPTQATPSAPTGPIPQPSSGWASDEHLGKAIGAINDYAVQPFNRMAEWGAQKGTDLADTAMAGLQARAQGSPASVADVQRLHPLATGAAEAVGGLVGSTLTDPRNWPLLATGGAQNAAKRLMSAGFSGQMLYGAYQKYPEVKRAMDSGDHLATARLMTDMGLQATMGGLSALHAVSSSPMPGTTEKPAPVTERVPTPEEAPSTLGKEGLEQIAQLKGPGKPDPALSKLDPKTAQTVIGQGKALSELRRPENQPDYSNWTPEEIAAHEKLNAASEAPPSTRVGQEQQVPPTTGAKEPAEATPAPSGPREPVPPSKGPPLTPPGNNPSSPKGDNFREPSYTFLKARIANLDNPNTPAPSLGDLTARIDESLKASPRSESTYRMVERVAKKQFGDVKDSVITGLATIHAQGRAALDAYLKPPQLDDFETSVGKFSGALNRSAWELRKFTDSIKDKMPDKLRREALTNWVQANGDDGVLADRALKTSPGRLQDGYLIARQLTPTEKSYGRMVRDHLDNLGNEALKQGLLSHLKDNYVQQVWNPPDQEGMNRIFGAGGSGFLRPNPTFAKQSFYDSYFDGEQAGLNPKDKDLGFLVANYTKSFNTALMSRSFISSLHEGVAKDGRPLSAPGGKGMPIGGDETGPDAYLIFPKAGPEETSDYRVIDHPALRDWKWATKDADGNPIFVQGDLRVHPQIYNKLDNILAQSNYKAPPVVEAILKGSTFFKQTLLTGAWFHQTQEGLHAIFHGVSPFSPKDINLSDPTTTKLLDGGLVLGNYNAMASFEEGLSTGGLFKYVPFAGQYLQRYNEYLFQDYIPRLKHAMASEAFERNLKRFKGEIDAGKLTEAQTARITANQANAAFGELNYITLGRDPRMQNAFRLMALAPDFTEARARFVGQALSPYGREQLVALGLRGAASMYVTARVVNYILNKGKDVDDPTFRDKPFSIVVNGQEYQQRSLPDDVWKLYEDPNGFMRHRLNPSTIRPAMEWLTGRDDFGRKRAFSQQAQDLFRSVLPIPLQGFFKKDEENDPVKSILQSFGTTVSEYRTPAQKMAHDYSLSNMPTDITSRHIMEQTRKMQKGKFKPEEVQEYIRKGEMAPEDMDKVYANQDTPEFLRNYKTLPAEQKFKVYFAAQPRERNMIDIEEGEPDPFTLPPNMRQKAAQKLQELQRK